MPAPGPRASGASVAARCTSAALKPAASNAARACRRVAPVQGHRPAHERREQHPEDADLRRLCVADVQIGEVAPVREASPARPRSAATACHLVPGQVAEQALGDDRQTPIAGAARRPARRCCRARHPAARRPPPRDGCALSEFIRSRARRLRAAISGQVGLDVGDPIPVALGESPAARREPSKRPRSPA